MDRFDAMQAFARVVETGSFTKAAETLHMSRTTVTQLIQQLEARLRVKLLNRTTRKVNVTADGAAYYERVLRLLADMDDAETSLSNAIAAPRGRLRVDVPSPFASTILIPALPQFYERYPDIHLHLGVSDRIIDLIDENVDCVVRGGEITNQSLVARPIGDLPLAIYASPAYLARMGTLTHPRELEASQHRIVGFYWSRSRRVFSPTMQRANERLVVQGHHSLVVDDGNAYVSAGVAGLGALWLPTYTARPHVERGDLVPLFPDWEIDPLPMYVAFQSNRHLSTKLRVFIDWVVELMRQQQQAESPPLQIAEGSARALRPENNALRRR